MQTIISQLDHAFRQAIHAAFGFDADPLVGLAQNEKFGDYQANAAMGLAKQLAERTGQKTNPRQVAEQIKAKLALGDMAQEVTIAGPGFINVRLAPGWLSTQLQSIRTDARVGVPLAASPRTTVVDYSGPNIAKEMHVGHLRSTIIGDAISRVLEFRGDNVIRQNHIGDWGTQFGMLIAYLKHGVHRAGSDAGPDGVHFPSGSPSGGAAIEDLEAFYRAAKRWFDDDTAFQDESRRTVVRLQAGEGEELALWRQIVAETRRSYQPLYERLGVGLKTEHERGESFYNPLLAAVVADLKAAGIAKESEGAIAVFNEGFENPLLIEKTGGGYLYGTTDLAAIRYRVSQLHAQRIIYTTDSRQSQHFAQVFDTARRAGWVEGVSLEHAPFGTMLGADGKPFKTRTGGTVKLKDLLDEADERGTAIARQKNTDRDVPMLDEQLPPIGHAVGVGAVKYSDLAKDRTSDYVFSWESMLALVGNTAPYLQYAHARVKSIFRRAEERGIRVDLAAATIRVESPFEAALAKHILRLGEVIDLVARELKPHHLCAYLYELATRFSGFFENCPVLQSEEPTRGSRLALVDLTARTMALGLDLLGIGHPDQM